MLVDDLREQLAAAVEAGDQGKAAELRARLDELTRRETR